MRGAWVICKRELHSYFVSPVAYAVMALFWAAEGVFFVSILNFWAHQGTRADALVRQYGAEGNTLNVPAMVAASFLDVTVWMLMFVVPIVAMALLAEEKRRRTMELLLTSPVTNAGIMLGKFAGAFAFVALLLAPTFAFQGFLAAFGENEIGPWISGYVGLLLIAAAMLAAALFASATTESQVVAAFVGYGILVIFFFLDALSNLLPSIWQDGVRWLSLANHFNSFKLGVIALRDINYYVSFTLLFLFLTHAALESIRWRGVRGQ